MVEVNASDARGKSDAKASTGMAGGRDAHRGCCRQYLTLACIVCGLAAHVGGTCSCVGKAVRFRLLAAQRRVLITMMAGSVHRQASHKHWRVRCCTPAGKLSNVVREMVTSQALAAASGHKRKQLLVMDEVDGMSGGTGQQDRTGGGGGGGGDAQPAQACLVLW